MSQQINLYDHLPKPERVVASSQQIVLLAGIFLLVLCLVSIYTRWQIWQRSQLVAELRKQQTEYTDKILRMGFEVPKLAKGEELGVAMRALQKRLSQRQKVQNYLHTTIGHNVRGFASYFVDFAEHSISGVWLKQITIEGSNDDVTLIGSANDTNLINQYLGRLHGTSNFHAKHFIRLKVSQAKKAKYVDFVVSYPSR